MGTATKPNSPAPFDEQKPSATEGQGYTVPPYSSPPYSPAAQGIPMPSPVPQGYPTAGAPPMQGPAPYPGYIIRAPRVPPQPGQVIVGYEIFKYQHGCCQCEGMSAAGLVSIIVLLLLFWPLAWIPCVMEECFETYQSPVFGYPQQMPTYASPPQAYPPGPGYPYPPQ